MPCYIPLSAEIISFQGETWRIDGRTDSPIIPYCEEMVTSGRWQKVRTAQVGTKVVVPAAVPSADEATSPVSPPVVPAPVVQQPLKPLSNLVRPASEPAKAAKAKAAKASVSPAMPSAVTQPVRQSRHVSEALRKKR